MFGTPHFSEAKFKPPNASFIFICFHLQLAFHGLYNVFCYVQIKLQNSKQKQQMNLNHLYKKLQQLHA